MHKTSELLEKYCERIEKELQDLYAKISKTDTLSTVDLDTMDKLLHSLKSNKTIAAMVEYDERDSDGGYSGAGNKYYNETRRYAGNNDYSGRRTSGYSRDSEREEMVRKLENMMTRVRNDDEALAIRDAIDTVNRMR